MNPADNADAPSFVLAPDTRILTLEELPDSFRRTLNAEPGDVVVDRPRQRRQSQLIGADTATLLEAFREPATIADALLRLSRQEDAEPFGLLESAFPAIKTLIEKELLIPSGADADALMAPRLKPGDQLGGYQVLRTVRSVEDCEVYQARDRAGKFVAIKIAGPRANPDMGQKILEEAGRLRTLSHLPVPRVLDTGSLDTGSLDTGAREAASYFVMSWIEGVPACIRSDQMRMADPCNQESLLRLCRTIAVTYGALHDAGLLHGDVRSSNILIDRGDKPHLIDFGMARPIEADLSEPVSRSLEFGSLEPEAAEALLLGELRPQTTKSEQFALATMLYRLATGRHHRTLAVDQERALGEIQAEDAMPPFTTVQCEAWPDLEAVLRRALAKAPDRRFVTVHGLADALSGVAFSRRPFRPSGDDRVPALVERTLAAACSTDATLETSFPSGPRASVHGGAAGLAWFLYRAALTRRDAVLLAQADRWAMQAGAGGGDIVALTSPGTGIDENLARRSSPLHDPSGPAAMTCLIAASHGDRRETAAALSRFLGVAEKRPRSRELFLGSAGTLATATALYDAVAEQEDLDCGALRDWISHSADETEAWIAQQAPIGRETALRHLGMAHGWAGVLYAALQARDALGTAPRGSTIERLEELACFATPVGRGLAWPGTVKASSTEPSTPAFVPGWCSGGAGYVYLWLNAFKATGDRRHRDRAEAAGWHAWEHPDRSRNLCCGLAGRALGLLSLYQATGEEEWRDRASRLIASGAQTLSAGQSLDLSLFRGDLGLGLAALELETPSTSCFPLFEAMGWRSA